MRVDSDRDTESTCQTKVRQFDDATAVYQQVLRLQVTMYHAALMTEQNRLQDLVQIALKNMQVRGKIP